MHRQDVLWHRLTHPRGDRPWLLPLAPHLAVGFEQKELCIYWLPVVAANLIEHNLDREIVVKRVRFVGSGGLSNTTSIVRLL